MPLSDYLNIGTSNKLTEILKTNEEEKKRKEALNKSVGVSAIQTVSNPVTKQTIIQKPVEPAEIKYPVVDSTQYRVYDSETQKMSSPLSNIFNVKPAVNVL
jgi:hypothetical protein